MKISRLEESAKKGTEAPSALYMNLSFKSAVRVTVLSLCFRAHPSAFQPIYSYPYHSENWSATFTQLTCRYRHPTNVRSVPETSFSQPELWRVLRLQFMSNLKTPKIWMGLVGVGWSLIHLDGWKFSSLMQKLIIFYGGLWQEFYHPVDSRPRTTFLMSLPSTTTNTTHAHLSFPFRARVDPYTGSRAIFHLQEKNFDYNLFPPPGFQFAQP